MSLGRGSQEQSVQGWRCVRKYRHTQGSDSRVGLQREKTKRSEKRMGWERRRVRLCEDFIIRPQRNEKSLESSEQQPLTVPLRLHQGWVRCWGEGAPATLGLSRTHNIQHFIFQTCSPSHFIFKINFTPFSSNICIHYGKNSSHK